MGVLEAKSQQLRGVRYVWRESGASQARARVRRAMLG